MMLTLLRSAAASLFVITAAGSVYAQETLLPRSNQSVDVGIVYDREVTGTLGIHTNGVYAGFTSGKLKTYYKTSYWGANLGVIKHPREAKTTDRAVQFGQNSGSFVYGKQNALIPVRVNKGWKRYYSGKDRRRGLAVGTSFELGVTAGIVKPYVLEISGDVNPQAQFFTYDQNPQGFLERGRINGTGGLKRGWSDASIVPGVNARAAIHLDWGAFDEFVKAVEAGVMVDAFPRAIPLLIDPAANTPLFVNFFVSVHLGKRR